MQICLGFLPLNLPVHYLHRSISEFMAGAPRVVKPQQLQNERFEVIANQDLLNSSSPLIEFLLIYLTGKPCRSTEEGSCGVMAAKWRFVNRNA